MADEPAIAALLTRGATWVDGSHARCRVVPSAAAGDGQGGVAANQTDTNWAGYIHNGLSAVPSSVSATYYVKTITGSDGDQAGAWVGLGGSAAAGGTLIQDGIIYSISSTGAKSAKFFWEIVPGYTSQPVTNSIGMTWGDEINVTTYYSGGNATFTFYDYRTNKAMSVPRASPAPGKSAECISERVGKDFTGTNNYPLANFASQAYTSCLYQLTGSTTPHNVAVSGGAWNAVQNGVTYLTTGAPSGTYGNFTVTWKHR